MKRYAILLLALACAFAVIVLLRLTLRHPESQPAVQDGVTSEGLGTGAQKQNDQQQPEPGRSDQTPTAALAPVPVEASAAASEVDSSVESMLPQPLTPARRLWKFKASLKSYRADDAKVMNAQFVLAFSIVAIMNSQGMAVIGNDEPDVVSKWSKRKGGTVISVDNLACWVDFKDFPEVEALRPFVEANGMARLRQPSTRPDGTAVPGVPPELDERIAHLADEALKLLETAAAK